MAIYIEIKKAVETSIYVDYEFSTTDDRSGILRISKEDGEIHIVKALPGDNNNHLFARASYKIQKYWKSGELPNKTCWAS